MTLSSEKQSSPLPPPRPGGEAPGQTYAEAGIIDPDQAVQTALASTEGLARQPEAGQPDPQTLRPLGRHMLGLLEAPDATEEQQAGARIILMNGTAVERQLLFVHDVTRITNSHNEEQTESAPAAGPTPLSRAATEVLPQLGSVQAMAEHSIGGGAVRRLHEQLLRGQAVSEDMLRQAVTEVRDRLVPVLHADDLVALLRTQRHKESNFMTIGKYGATTPDALRALIRKGEELDPVAGESRAVIAEAALKVSEIASEAAADLRGQKGFLRTRRAAKVDEATRQAEAEVYRLLPHDIHVLCTDADFSFDRNTLGTVIDAAEAGLSPQALRGITLVEPDFLQARRFAGARGDIAVLNTAGEALLHDRQAAALIEKVRGGWVLSAMTHELQVANEIAGRPGLRHNVVANPAAGARLVSLIKEYEPAEREHTLALLERLSDSPSLDAALLSMRNPDQFTALKAVLASPDHSSFRELRALLSTPHFAAFLAEGQLPTASSENMVAHLLTDTDPKSSYAQARRQTVALLEAAGVADIEDSALGAEITKRYLRDALALHGRALAQADLSTLPFEALQAKARQAGELFAFPGVQAAMSLLHQRNPETASLIVDGLLYGDNTDLVRRVQVLTELASLPPHTLGIAELAAIKRAGPNQDIVQAVTTYHRLGLQDLTGRKGIFAARADVVLLWIFDPTSGTIAEKEALLHSKLAQAYLATARRGGARMYAQGFAEQIASGQAIDAVSQYMAECVAISRDEQLEANLYDLAKGSYPVAELWRAVLSSSSPREGAERLRGLGVQNAGFLHILAKHDTDLLQGVLRGYLRTDDPARYAGEWQTIVHDMHLLEFVGRQGAQVALRQQIIGPLLASDNPLALARRFEDQLIQDRPLWRTNYEIARMLIGEAGYHEGMMVHEVPVALPIGNRKLSAAERDQLPSGELLKPIAAMSADEKRLFLGGQGWTGERLAQLESVPFNDLDHDVQQTLLLYRMFETVERSRSERLRGEATRRNMALVLNGESVWQPGSLVHFTDVSNTGGIMLSGNLATEVVNYNASSDNFPFNVDFWCIGADVAMLPSDQARFDALPTGYGGVALHYRRDPGGYRAGEEFASGAPGVHHTHDHYLMFAGMPSTELTAITAANPADVEQLRRGLVEFGMYVPVYSPDGTLHFTPEQYQQRRQDRNYDAVPVEIIDSVFVVKDTKQGSNDGAEVYIPGPDRRPQKWYAKIVDLAAEHSLDRLWTESLTDEIYRAVRPDLVPETKVVIINGRLARISRMDETTEAVTDAGRNAGFVLDCLTINWDVVYGGDNLVGAQGKRIDNGGALDIMPNADTKKTAEWLSAEVRELQVGTDNERLGLGMRQKYPGLTDDDIKAQARELQERLTDNVIDRLVDNTRRSRADRAMLKRLIKGRRDYIISYAANLP